MCFCQCILIFVLSASILNVITRDFNEFPFYIDARLTRGIDKIEISKGQVAEINSSGLRRFNHFAENIEIFREIFFS